MRKILSSFRSNLLTFSAAFLSLAFCTILPSCAKKIENVADEFEIFPDDDRPVPNRVIFGETDISELPSILIETQLDVGDKYVAASIGIDGGRRTEWTQGAANAKIKVRGHHSASHNKKPFAIKFSSPQDLCGMKKAKNWVLLADSMDNTHLRNDLMFFLNRRLGASWTPAGRHCYVFLNERFLGLYYVCEKIEDGKNRVNINKSKDILLEIDKYYDGDFQFRSDKFGMPYMIKSDADDATIAKFRSFVRKMEDEICENPASCRKYFDYDSWAKWFLVKVVISHDVYDEENSRWRSIWAFFKDGKIFASATWDADSAFASRLKLEDFPVFYFDAMLRDEKFVQTMFKIWQESALSIEEIGKFLDAKKTLLARPYALDCLVWGEHADNYIVRNISPQEYSHFPDYSEQVDFLKEFCAQQIQLLNEQCEKNAFDVSAW